jgi:hypothetical protein
MAKLIPYLQVGRLKKALPHLIERNLAGEAAPPIDPTKVKTCSVPEAGRRYFGLGKASSYEHAYEIKI